MMSAHIHAHKRDRPRTRSIHHERPGIGRDVGAGRGGTRIKSAVGVDPARVKRGKMPTEKVGSPCVEREKEVGRDF